jgi:uncharacterized RDD family membrane protein YckC
MHNQEMEYQTATKGRRIVAFVIDNFVMTVFLLIIFSKQWEVAVESKNFVLFFADKFLPLTLLTLIYHTLFTWQYGMTFGKMVTKIRVIEIETGYTPSLNTALIRSGVRVISDNSLLLGYIVAFFSPLLQTFHDKLAKTVVVNA